MNRCSQEHVQRLALRAIKDKEANDIHYLVKLRILSEVTGLSLEKCEENIQRLANGEIL